MALTLPDYCRKTSEVVGHWFSLARVRVTKEVACIGAECVSDATTVVAKCKKSSFFDPIEYIRKEENLVDMEACQAVFDCTASYESETFKHYVLLASTSFRNFKKIADVLRDESIDSEYNNVHTIFLEPKAIFSIATLLHCRVSTVERWRKAAIVVQDCPRNR